MANSDIWYIGKPADQAFLESRVEDGLVCLEELPLTVEAAPRLIVLDLSFPAALEGLQQLTQDQGFLAVPIVLLSKRRIGGAIAQAMLSPADIRWVVQSPLEEARIPESLELLLHPNAEASVAAEPDVVLSEEIQQELREALSHLEILEAEGLEQRERLEDAELSNQNLTLRAETVEAQAEALQEENKVLSEHVLGLERSLLDARTAGDHTRAQLDTAVERLELADAEQKALNVAIEEAQADLGARDEALRKAMLLKEELEEQRNRAIEEQRITNSARLELESERDKLAASVELALQETEASVQAFESAKLTSIQVEEAAKLAEEQSQEQIVSLESDVQAAQNELEKTQALLQQVQKDGVQKQEQIDSTKDWAVEVEQQLAQVEVRLVELENDLSTANAQLAESQLEAEKVLSASREAEQKHGEEREEAKAALAVSEAQLVSVQEQIVQLEQAVQEHSAANQRLQTAHDEQKTWAIEAEQRVAETEERLAKNAQQSENEAVAAREQFIADLATVEERAASSEEVVGQLTLAAQEQSEDIQRLQNAEQAQTKRAEDAEAQIAELEQQALAMTTGLSLAEENLSKALAQVESETEKAQSALSVATKATEDAKRFEQQAAESRTLAESAKHQSEEAEAARAASELESETSNAARIAADSARVAADSAREATESSLDEALAAAAKTQSEYTERIEQQAERMLAIEARCEEQEATLLAQMREIAAGEEQIEDLTELAERNSREWEQQATDLNQQIAEHREASQAAKSKSLETEKALDLKRKALEELNESMTALAQEKADVVVQVGLLEASGLALQERLDATQRSHEDTRGELSTMVEQHAEQVSENSKLSESLERSQNELRDKVAAEKEISMQLVALESNLSQERSQVQALNLKLAETLEAMDGQEQEAERVQASLQSANEKLKTRFDETSIRLEQAESKSQEALAAAIKTEREKAKSQVDAAVALATREAEAEAAKIKEEYQGAPTLRNEVESLRNEAKGLRESRDRLQGKLSEASVRLDDEKERVRTATKAGVVWSARREPPKDESLLGKLKSPFKKG